MTSFTVLCIWRSSSPCLSDIQNLIDCASLFSFQNMESEQRELFQEIEGMDWSDIPTSNIADDLLQDTTCQRCGAFCSTYDALNKHLRVHTEYDSICNDIRQTEEPMDVDDFNNIEDTTFLDADELVNNVQDVFQTGAGLPDYNIKLMKTKSLKRMGTTDVNYKLTFNHHMFQEKKKVTEMTDVLKRAFQDMIDHVRKELQPGDIMRGAINNDNLSHSIFVPCRRMEEMNADAMLESLINVLNSNENIPFDSTTSVDIGAIKYPRGGHGMKFSSLDLNIKNKKSIVQIHNDDNTCLVRAVLVSYAQLCQTTTEDFNKIMECQPPKTVPEFLLDHGACPRWFAIDVRNCNKSGYQTRLTEELCSRLNLTTSRPLTYESIPFIEDYLNVSIYVVSAKMGNAFSYVSRTRYTDRKKIYIYHMEEDDVGHFHSIVNIVGFFNNSYFCQSCLKSYSNADQHVCVSHCNVCLSDDCWKGQEIECPNCHRICRSKDCLARHKIESDDGKSACQTAFRCATCNKVCKTSVFSYTGQENPTGSLVLDFSVWYCLSGTALPVR